MSIGAKVIVDSCQGMTPDRPVRRLTTFELRYPRFIHAELMTHRVFSRNASSSRAIPIQKLIDEVVNDPAMPVWWGKNQAGMQAREELSDEHHYWEDVQCMSKRDMAKFQWLHARDLAVQQVRKLMDIGLHKQLANRLLEPWSHITVLVTSTDWANWYALRNHPDAQPEMQALAETMLKAHRFSRPKFLLPGQWHLPYIHDYEREDLVVDGEAFLPDDYGPVVKDLALYLPKISAARSARVSYLKHDGATSAPTEDLNLYGDLMGGNLKHASPTEHQARVPVPEDYEDRGEAGLEFKYPSNLCGWVQHRKLVKGENVRSYEEFDR